MSSKRKMICIGFQRVSKNQDLVLYTCRSYLKWNIFSTWPCNTSPKYAAFWFEINLKCLINSTAGSHVLIKKQEACSYIHIHLCTWSCMTGYVWKEISTYGRTAYCGWRRRQKTEPDSDVVDGGRRPNQSILFKYVRRTHRKMLDETSPYFLSSKLILV